MLDIHPVWLTLAASLTLVTLVWLVSLAKRDAGVIDIFWGPGFVLIAWIQFGLLDGFALRRGLLAALVTLWGLRLSIHILARSRGKPEDYRYRAMRERQGPRFAWLSLVSVFWLQGALMWVLSAPLYRAQASAVPDRWTWVDALALLCFVAGFLFEAVADLQLTRFKADPANRGKLLTHGLWRYSRHPNYFGDAMVWVGFGLFALATPGSWWTIYSPILMTVLLMRVSGVPLLEKKMSSTKPGYREYVDRTNAFFPWFPRRAGS